MIQKFLWEATFSQEASKKVITRDDTSYAAGCCFRSVSCINQVQFAINEQYCTNEKGVVLLINSFPVIPRNFKDKVNEVFELITTKTRKIN
jgi:hypothetical protein